MKTIQQLHPSFKFNGLQFENAEEIILFAEKLIATGADYERAIAKFIIKWFDAKPFIKVKTSGSTGKPKKIHLKKKYMVRSAYATGVYFKMGAGNTALLCLSANYIAGKMMLVRALTMGWDLHVVAPEKDAITQYDNTYDFAAMVPYQVYHTLDDLNKIKRLIIGGGALPRDLEEKLQTKTTEAFATYGMTETITHVAVRRVNGAGKTQSYYALPDVSFETDPRGCLVIIAPKITDINIITNDLVSLHSPKSFDWLGRFDNVINSGGVKLYPEKIEAQLQGLIHVPFIVSSLKDEALGEQLILVLELQNPSEATKYKEVLLQLTSFERPKKVYTLSKFPQTETGKIRRKEIQQVVQSHRN